MLDPVGKKRYNTDGVHKKVTFLWRKRVFMEGKMIETLRKKTRTSYIIRAILTLVIAIGLLVWTKFTIFDVLTGPAKMDISKDPSTYEGKYVTLDVDCLLTDFVEHTTTTTRKYGGKTTTVNGNSYIAFQSVYDYESGMSTWYFYSIYMSKGDQSMMTSRIDAAWEYLNDETGTVAPPEKLPVKGSWTKMDAQIERYFRDTLAEMGVVQDEYNQYYFYTLDTDKLGGVNMFAFWAMNGAALILLLVFVFSVIGCFGNAYMKDINNYLQRDPSASMEAIESDFSGAHVVGGDTWIGKRWTVYRSGTKARILSNKDLIGGYYFRRTGRNSVSEMRLYKTDKTIVHIDMTENETKEALGYYAQEQPHIIVGYSADLEKKWQKDFNGFLDMQYNPNQTRG